MLEYREMDERARQERNRYFREYRARNPDRVRETNRRYWMKRAAKRAQEQEAAHAAENAHD